MNKIQFVSSNAAKLGCGVENVFVGRELDLQTADNEGFVAILVLEAKKCSAVRPTDGRNPKDEASSNCESNVAN